RRTRMCVIDLAVAREHGRSVYGPAPSEVIGPVPRGLVLEALWALLDWQERVEPWAPNTALNAARVWHYADEGRWASKADAAAWAAQRTRVPGLLAEALAQRRAGRCELPREEVDVLLAEARGALAAAADRVRPGL